MHTFIKDYLVPILTVVINGILSYFINQLPGIRPDPEKGITGLSDTSIFAITAICVAALCILTFATKSQQNSTQGNINSPSQNLQSNWIGGFLLFLLGLLLYGLLQLNIIPKQSSIQFGFIPLILCGFGAIVPSFLLIPKWWQNILLLLSSGIAASLSIHYFSAANLKAAFISVIVTFITFILLIARDFLVQVIRKVALFWEEYQNQQAIGISQFIINQLEDLVSPFNRNYYKALEYQCRDDETQGLDNETTLELQKVFVQLKIVAKSVSNTRQDIIPIPLNVNTLSEVTIWDCLAAKNDQGNSKYKRLVILGRPGCGKTTLLRYLTLVYVTKQKQTINRKISKLIPVLFYLREVRDIIISQNSPLELETLIKQQIEKLKINNKHLSPPSNWVNNKLQYNKFIIMLDGLDEVADKDQRQQVRTWVENQMEHYPDTIFILTSRPNGYRELQSKKSVDELEVQAFNREQVTEFLHLWYLQTEIRSRAGNYDEGVKQVAEEQANQLINRIVDSRPLAAMAINPLLLKMIATVHRRGNVLPGKRVELYKEICQILLEKRQRAKNITVGLTALQKQSILQELALKLMQNQTREFTLSQAENWISKEVQSLPKLNNIEAFIKDIRDESALLIEKEIGIYELAHLSFQEYLAAIEVKESNQEQILISNINEIWWAETIRLYAAQVNASNLVSAVVNMSPPSINAFLVVADYEEEGWRLDQNVRQKLEEKLNDNLNSSDPKFFQLAAQVKLVRRLSKLVRIDEELEIDNDSYITCAEYQLFLDDEGNNNRFPTGDAKKTIRGISWSDANRFCLWLKLWSEKQGLNNQLTESVTFYRLPTQNERTQHPINDDPQFSDNGIRIVKFQLPSRYSQLANYLLSGEWKKADEETFSIMLQVSNKQNKGYLDVEDIENFPCDDLRRIDFLWVYASKGHFGFSVQKNIYQSLGGTSEYNEKVWKKFGDRVGWRVNKSWFNNETYDTTAPMGHLPIINHFSQVLVQNDWVLFSRVQTCKL